MFYRTMTMLFENFFFDLRESEREKRNKRTESCFQQYFKLRYKCMEFGYVLNLDETKQNKNGKVLMKYGCCTFVNLEFRAHTETHCVV